MTDELTEEELLAEVELAVDFIVETEATKRRAKTIRSCARESYRRYRKARGLPCQPDEVPPSPKTEAVKPKLYPFAKTPEATLLTEDGAQVPPDPERDRKWEAAMERTGSVVISGRYPWALPEDDGTIPTGAA
jgi:hypothetical protein